MPFEEFRRRFDQPSGVFAGLGQPQLTAVGVELDHTGAELLRAITGRACCWPEVGQAAPRATREVAVACWTGSSLSARRTR
jgi:hypothetical protein